MMSPNKRRLTDVFKEYVDYDSSKHRRSSLQVNLSYSSDSGNDSLRRTYCDGNDFTVDENQCDDDLIAHRMRSRSTKNETIKSRRSGKTYHSENEKNLHDRPVHRKNKKVSELVDINQQEQALNSNCEKLKEAILSKTREIFDRQNEFSLKTTIVLDCTRNDIINGAQNVCVMSKIIDKNVEEENTITVDSNENDCGLLTDSTKRIQKCDNHSVITATPKVVRSIMKLSRKFKPSKKRLFTHNDATESVAIEESYELRKDTPGPSIYDSNNDPISPILSGSNRRSNRFLLRNLHKSNFRKIKGNEAMESATSTTNLTASEDEFEDANADLPIVCSTFIEDDGRCDRNIMNNRPGTEETNSSQLRAITMSHAPDQTGDKELTLRTVESNEISNSNKNENKKIRERNSLLNDPCSLLQQENVNPAVVDQSATTIIVMNSGKRKENTAMITQHNTISMELTTIQNNISLQEEDAGNSSTHNNKNNEHTRNDTNESDKTARSSLDVNTSIDALHEDNKCNSNKSQCRQTVLHTNHKEDKTLPDYTAPFEKDRESINTVRSSLHVNTSLDCVSKSPVVENGASANIEKREVEPLTKRDNILNDLEDMSLLERLRNIPSRKQMQQNNKESNEKRNSSGPSFIEGTPIVLLTRLKQYNFPQNVSHEENRSHSLPSTFCEIHKTVVCNERIGVNCKLRKTPSRVLAHQAHTSGKILQRDQQHTIILDDSTLYSKANSFEKQAPGTINQMVSPVVINDTVSETESFKDRENINSKQQADVTSKTRGKKKLLPLRENSQLISLTPVENVVKTPEQPRLIKKRRKRYSKFLKQKTGKRQPKEDEVKDIQNDSEDIDDFLPSSKTLNSPKSQKRKQKKSRKIVSKKIVIKKFANEDVIKELQKNRKLCIDRQHEDDANRSSMSDFQENKIISTTKLSRPQKIVIVVTGLSKGDKCLVKSVVQALGKAKIEQTVTRHTTHVVSTGVRTINLLHGIIRGCWLVSLEWVLQSLENNKWLNPEQYEMKHFSKAVLGNRRDRQLLGAFYIPELFATCGFIYITSNTTPPAPILKGLVKAGGGLITEDLKTAKVVVGTEGLKESWVLDSITTGELQPLNEYRRK